MQARPEASHHRMNYMGTTGRRLQQGPPGTVPEDVETTQPDAAMTPMSAPGMPKTSPLLPMCSAVWECIPTVAQLALLCCDAGGLLIPLSASGTLEPPLPLDELCCFALEAHTALAAACVGMT